MRLLMSAALACVTALTPVKLLAADVALLISNVQNAGFPRAREINAEIGQLVQSYRDDGFTVLVERDVRLAGMENALRRFEAESRNADRAIIHYVGSLVESDHSLFLKPVNFASQSIVDRHTNTISLDVLFELLSHRPGRSALVLASPADDIAAKVDAGSHVPQGVLVLAGFGLTTNRAIREGLLKGDETGIQLNARNELTATGFVSDFNLASRRTENQSFGTPADSALIEMRDWRAAAQNGTQAALQNYINRYPNGLFRGEAQARIDALSPPKSIEQTVEEALRLSRADRRKIQENLTLLGFNTRGVDGLFGPGSRAAIERWQRTEGFRPSGFLDRAQIRVLDESARVKAEANRVAQERDDLAYWQQTGSGTNERGLRDYLAKYPTGLFATQAKQALARVQGNSNSQQNEAFAQRENALKMNAQTRRLVEQRLVGLGYEPGPVDGNFTRETRIAIRSFQQKSGLNATGYMDNQTVTRLVASIFR